MRLRSQEEPKLCPDCPLKGWVQEAKAGIKEKQFIRVKDEPTNLRICMELRKIAREIGLGCEYYPESESMLMYVNVIRTK